MATMLLDEKKDLIVNADFKPVVVNFADDAKNPSVTTIGAFPEKADEEKVAKKEKDESDSDKKKEDEKAAKEKEKNEATSQPEKKDEESEESLQETKKIAEKYKEIDPVQKRINEITRKRREAERELEFERKKRAEVEVELEKIRANIPLTEKPKMENFETEEAYSEALMDWKIENRLKIEKEKKTKELNEKSEKEQFTASLNAIETNMEKGSEKYEDFSELVLNDDLKISESMVEALISSKIAEDILYYLGKNPDISAKIAKKNPFDAAREIGLIEAKLLMPVPKKNITKAPEPIIPVKTTNVIDKTVESRSLKEWKDWVRSLHK